MASMRSLRRNQNFTRNVHYFAKVAPRNIFPIAALSLSSGEAQE
jgi:hypothetical protein